ncbi:M20 family metallopeptidase [Rhodovibrionaceae bacterium A322]
MPDQPSSTAASNSPKIVAEDILEGILEWVEMETPSTDAEAVNGLVSKVQGQFADLGVKSIERVAGTDGWGDPLIIRVPDADGNLPSPDNKGLLVLAHLDTVHPIGSKESDLVVRRDGDRVYGPGIYDMKAGSYFAYYAYRHLLREGKQPNSPITFIYVPEEEVGTPITRPLIEAEAPQTKCVLVPEPARDGGKIVTARKGVARFCITATGRPAHAGARHQDGRSAIKEMARVILAIEALTDYDAGVTFNVGLINGGTGVNVVPRQCYIEVDMRVISSEQGEEFSEKIFALTAQDPDVDLTIEGGMNRPPYKVTEESQALFDRCHDLVAETGLELVATELTGGGSDGNFTSALGLPTLDGLGADGAGAHTLDEFVLFSSLEPRARMWVKLLESL